jgi:hypothetical protein
MEPDTRGECDRSYGNPLASIASGRRRRAAIEITAMGLHEGSCHVLRGHLCVLWLSVCLDKAGLRSRRKRSKVSAALIAENSRGLDRILLDTSAAMEGR